jgi:F0F1-type ATP synthase membrane subunit b/b'
MSSDFAVEIMKWLNFFLLAGLIGKFGIPPLLRWLDAESDKIQATSQSRVQEALEVKQQVDQARKKLEDFDKEYEEIKNLTLHRAKNILQILQDETQLELHRLHRLGENEIQGIWAEAKKKNHQETVAQAILESQILLSSVLQEQDHYQWNRQISEFLLNNNNRVSS